MSFFVRIFVLLLLGGVIAAIVGCSFDSPAAGVLAFVVLALMARKGIIEEPKDEGDDGGDDDVYM